VYRIRAEFEESLQTLQRLGYRVAATPGTAAYYAQRGITGIVCLSKPTDPASPPPSQTVTRSNASDEVETGAVLAAPSVTASAEDDTRAGRTEQGAVLDWIRAKKVDLVVNIPEGSTRTDEITAGYLMRRTAVDFGCSLLTNIK
jgi:carbamoyl-phosphate synthase/aspartate carbamoyltransferase